MPYQVPREPQPPAGSLGCVARADKVAIFRLRQYETQFKGKGFAAGAAPPRAGRP